MQGSKEDDQKIIFKKKHFFHKKLYFLKKSYFSKKYNILKKNHFFQKNHIFIIFFLISCAQHSVKPFTCLFFKQRQKANIGKLVKSMQYDGY